MSSLIYGSLSRSRVGTPPGKSLATTAADPSGTPSGSATKVSKWQDALAALVPAEVLGLHAVAMSYGTTTKGSGASAVTTIDHPGEMRAVYVALLVLSVVLYFAGARQVKKLQWVRAAIPAVAFVLWTMIQPSTAFDAWSFHLDSFARVMVAVIGAVVLGGVTSLLAGKADDS